ncbi:4-hydroxy-tetrahydrodipicolinate reductase [Salibacter halophilus]|uniref:4-hydroxy-tetrahydrodipicolinate reductase n=1 Tax=Salibacter halophilus TaxID=1803916 RepID=A0A6N6M6E3_9FLAO|nr:4-hydroxy-tetrahydrodipicolinate reductase [Salibacter halophilus]KAB1065177.1 4-hydroxy-tetrahydrodipicolinate reductase [Salibacter halophilus]
MKIAILGYGRMGKIIEEKALERGHSISAKITSENVDEIEKALSEADVAIEFSIPEAAKENILKAFDHSCPIVVGTTGWYDDFSEIESACNKHNGTLFYATNFSVGVNLTFKMNEILAKLMNGQSQYSASIEETHHIHKKDAPSGTAISLAEGILKNNDRYENWKLKEKDTGFADSELPVEAFRIDEVPGTHIIEYDSEIDKISLKHEAKSRSGFALGAVLAAEYAAEHSGILTMKDLLKFD